jgi:hypothetical protein
MATQTITLVAIAGVTGAEIARALSDLQKEQARTAIDELSLRLKANRSGPPVIWYSEWLDGWSMGDEPIFGRGAQGNVFHVRTLTRVQAKRAAGRVGMQFPEQRWLKNQLEECVKAFRAVAPEATILVIRQVHGASTTDGDVIRSTESVAPWLLDDPRLTSPEAS